MSSTVTTQKPSLLASVKAWFYIPSNRTAFVAFLTGLVTAGGHVLDHSVPLYAAAIPEIYAAIHLVFPDFNINAAEVQAIASAITAPTPVEPAK